LAGENQEPDELGVGRGGLPFVQEAQNRNKREPGAKMMRIKGESQSIRKKKTRRLKAKKKTWEGGAKPWGKEGGK